MERDAPIPLPPAQAGPHFFSISSSPPSPRAGLSGHTDLLRESESLPTTPAYVPPTITSPPTFHHTSSTMSYPTAHMAHQMGPSASVPVGCSSAATAASFGTGPVFTAPPQAAMPTIYEEIASVRQMLQEQTRALAAALGGMSYPSTPQVPSRSTPPPGYTSATHGTSDHGIPTLSPHEETRLQKFLTKGPADTTAFDPKSEEELDKLASKWYRWASSIGCPSHLLKFVVMRMGSPPVLHALRTSNLMSLPTWEVFVDQLAWSLFPTSDYLRQVENSLRGGTPMEDVNAAIREVDDLYYAYTNLCRRWNWPMSFHDQQLKISLMNRLPEQDLAWVARQGWKRMELTAFKGLCLQAREGSIICSERVTPAALPLALGPGPIDPEDVDDIQVCVGDGRVCFLCQSPDHLARNCPTAPRCGTCQRRGHVTADCQRIQIDTQLGASEGFLRRTGRGIIFEIHSVQDQAGIMRRLAAFFQNQQERAEHVRRRARERRIERALEDADGGDGGPDGQDGGAGDGMVIDAFFLMIAPLLSYAIFILYFMIDHLPFFVPHRRSSLNPA